METDKVFTTKSFDGEGRAIPLAIQTYFWRQTSQLLKPKLVRRNYESACISFERIICENRIQDLQPSLASAVKSINRWHLIQSSVPYILQCCSKLLANRFRLGSLERLGNAERELLYTLHWILLEAPHVCCVVDTESLLYPQTIIEQFVHGLIPHVYSVRENDLTFRLENGIAIWGPLWKHEKPQLTPFITEVIKKDAESEVEKLVSYEHTHPGAESDFSAASFFDVAVLKCVASTGWAEDGVVWALRYLTEYLKKEFNLPDEAVQGGCSPEIDVSNTACQPPVQNNEMLLGGAKCLSVDSSEKNLNLDREALKNISVEERALESEEHVEKEACQLLVSNKASEKILKKSDIVGNEETPVCIGIGNKKDKSAKGNDDLANEYEAPLGVCKTPSSSEEGKQAFSSLERAGSIRLRIRVGSSPVLRGGGRVITAMASPTGSPFQNGANKDNDKEPSVNDGDAKTLQIPKVFIKPSPSHQPQFLSATKNDIFDTCPIWSAQNNAVNSESIDVSYLKKDSGTICSPSERNATMTRDCGQSVNGPSQPKLQDSSRLSGAFESIVSFESEGDFSKGRRIVQGAPMFQQHSGGQTLSQASNSSAESESQPLLNSNSTTTQLRATSILESLDTPRSSLSANQESLIRMDRYFVFQGAADYITNDGRLSLLMILQALHSILRNNPTTRICDAALAVLFQIDKIHEIIETKKRSSSFEYDDRTVAETQAVGFRSPHSDNVLGRLRASFYGRPPSFLTMSLGCLISLIKALGCPLGCGEGCRGMIADRLRNQASDLLSQLYKREKTAFKMWLQQYVRLEPHQDLVDFLHALLGFCENEQEQSDDEMTVGPKPVKKKELFAIPEGVNGVIIGEVFKILLSRVAEMNFFDVSNLTFYGELRQLLRFVKESYGGVFWKVALSGLLDSAFKETKDKPDGNKSNDQGTLSRAVVGKFHRKVTKISKVERTPTCKTKRRFLQKFSRVMTENSEGPSSLSKLPSVVDSSPLQMALSPRSKRKIFTLGTWRKQKCVGTPFDSTEDLLDVESLPDQSSSAKRKLLKSKSSTKRKLDDVFAITRKLTESSFPEPSLPVNVVVREVEAKPVDLQALRAGMGRLRFLLYGCQPGSVPDPKIVASMLDLEAPAVARACLLLECCLIVNKCNQGEWPQWIRGSLPSLARRRSNAASSFAGMFAQRRNLVAMHEAGTLFHAWGVALGKKLEQALAKRRREVLPSIDEEGGKPAATEEEEMEEDFLDEASLSNSVKVCPCPLLMIACQLLLEITAFLRESHGQYSAHKPPSRPLHRVPGRRKLSVATNRRSVIFSPESRHGGQRETIRRSSVWSQASLPTDFNSSPSRILPEPPTITVSETDQSKSNLEAPDHEGVKRERLDSTERTRHRSSLYFPRNSTQSSPKSARKAAKRISPIGGEGDSVRFRSKSTRNEAKHLSVDPTAMPDDEDESDEEDISANLPWMTAVIQLNSSTVFICDHSGLCPSNCHQRQSRSCTRMVKAMKAVYSTSSKLDKSADKMMGRVYGSPLISAPQIAGTEQSSNREKDDEEMIQYIISNISSLTHCPFSVIAKAGIVIETEHLMETLPVVWELLLDEDQQLVSSVAAVFLLSAIRLEEAVKQMLCKELGCMDPNDRVKSLQRFEVLWQSRYHAWPRLQEGARLILKVPPAKLDFTLPSPAVGMPPSHPPNCPWDACQLLEEVQGKKKGAKKTRDSGNELKKRQERCEYLMRAVPVSMEATVGVNVTEDDKERYARLDVWHYHLDATGNSGDGNEEDTGESQQVDAELWPQAVSCAIPCIIEMMDDVMVASDKRAVMEVARRLVWQCLVDDPVLFFRTILEQFTKKDKQEEQVSLLRKLLLYITELPPTSSRFLINNLIGVAMFYARTNKPGSEDSLTLVLSLLWQAVPSVRGFLFKDLKQCLRKEHCDNALRVSSNVPGAKKLCVILPDQDNIENNEDQEKTKETVPVHDEMTFGKILEEFKSRLQNSNEDKELYLIDKKSDQILEDRYHVRDVYTYRKGFSSPLLLLEFLDEEPAFNKRQAQAFTAKIAEIGRVLLTSSMLKALPNQKHVSFLHEEFSRQISFPRKALDCDFSLYAGGTKGNELAALDVVHKSVWVELITSLFQCMSPDFPWGCADLNLFLNVINGAILLHCEDGAMLRLCLASLINIAVHFTNIFAIDGYQHIFPSLLQVYAHQQSNEMVTTSIEFALKQFYTLHQKPCLLQLFASVAPLLLVETRIDGNGEESELEDLAGKIPSKCLFALLTSLDRPSPDNLEILEMIKAEKPLKPMDSCYESSNDPPGASQIDTAVRLCVTVVNFAPESQRAVQMVVVLSAILPHYLDYLKSESDSADSEDKVKAEVTALFSLVTSMNVLVKSSEVLTRSFVHFQSYKSISDKSGIFPDLASTTSLILGRGSISSVEADEADWGKGRPFLERLRAQEEKDEVMQALDEYRKPRDALLILVSDYIRICAPRLEDLEEALPPRHTVPELLDSISVNTLSQIVFSLLKLAVYDQVTLASLGVQRYMTEALPLLKGSPEATEAAILLILKRVNKMFEKFVNKPDLTRCIDWKTLEVYIKGLYLIMCKRPSIAHSPYMKSLVKMCISLVIQERSVAAISVAANLPFAPMLSPPLFFSDTVIKLASRLMHVIKEQCSLKELCGNTDNLGSPARTEKIFVRLILPICIRLGSGRSDAPKASLSDVSYALSCFLATVTTKNPETPGQNPIRLSFVEESLDLPRSLTFSVPHEARTSVGEIPDSLYVAAYLGLKVLMVCFEDSLASEWYRIYQAMETVVDSNICNVGFWDFMNFCVSHRTPLFLLIMPLITTKVVHLRYKSAVERALKQRVLEKLSRAPLMVNCRNALIAHFVNELSDIKQKRPKAGLEEIGEKGETWKEEENTFVLQPPPLGRERSSSAPDEPSKTKTEEGKPILMRSASVRVKKSVSFSPAQSFDEDQGTVHSSPKEFGKDTRKKRLLQKQESVEEHEDHNSKPLLTIDSSGAGAGPFGHQRGAAVRSGKTPRRFADRFRAAAATVIAERRASAGASSSASTGMKAKAGRKAVGIVESRGKRFEMEGFVTDEIKSDAASDRKESQASLTPPMARPESVTISFSPSGSPSRGSPLQDTDGSCPDILESIAPLPPVPPDKIRVRQDGKRDSNSVNERNGSATAEFNWKLPDYDLEGGHRLNRTRWWHKVYSEGEASQSISAFDDSESERETIV